MSEIGYTILGFAIGYFWAMYRVDNIRLTVKTLDNRISVNMAEFWEQTEEWKARQGEKGHQE